jgi:sialate O-acetylesterase
MSEKGLTIAPIICDGMILQRDTVNRIYGKERIADSVTISFMNTLYTAKVNDKYNFSIELPPIAAGGPYSMTIKGSSEITITDILFGDVYILSGQSNMELPIGRVLDVSEEEVKQTYEPTIRQYLMPATFNFSEPEEFMYSGSWKKATEDELLGFSAAGYFFAKEIKETYNIPVGLIMTAVGGSKIESWMNPLTLSKYGDYELVVELFKDKKYFNNYIEEQQKAANQWVHQLEEEEDKYCAGEIDNEWNTCVVPSLVSDYIDGNFQGSIYLCKEVNIDEEPTGKEADIYLGTIIDSDRVYINGHLIGRTEYRYPPRKYKFEKGILKKGRI